MPQFGFLLSRKLEADNIAEHLKVNRIVGVPYTDEMVQNAAADLKAQVNPDGDGVEAFKSRYAKVSVRDFDGNPKMISEMDALVAYLQMLGTLVDFDAYKAEENLR